MEAVQNCGVDNRTANPMVQALMSIGDVMDAFSIQPKEVILGLAEDTSCHARMVATQRKGDKAFNIRVGSALILASRPGIPVVAEDSLVSQGIAGADGASYDVLRDLREFRADLPLVSQRSRIENAAFEAAPLARRGSHSVRCRAAAASDSPHLNVPRHRYHGGACPQSPPS